LGDVFEENVSSLCKTYCYTNRYQFICTVDGQWGRPNKETASLCEWGNSAYAWMLEELSHPNRLEKIAGEKLLVVKKYFTKIIHSTIFLERFKNWRFQRQIRVPEYIKTLDADACKVFWWLCDQDTIPNIAQRLSRSEHEVHQLVQKIQVELHKRHRSHLLNLERLVPFSNLQPEDDASVTPDVHYEDTPLEDRELHNKVKHGYDKLSWMEQFVVDSMVIDGLSAQSVVHSLAEQNLTTDDRIAPTDLNAQHVYYFLRKTLTKLKNLVEIA
ncbi:hypothetical protein, partial [Kaarinaea lacus]